MQACCETLFFVANVAIIALNERTLRFFLDDVHVRPLLGVPTHGQFVSPFTRGYALALKNYFYTGMNPAKIPFVIYTGQEN